MQMPQADEASLLDLIHHLLQVGVTTGLFKRLHQDGTRTFYTIAAEAAILYPGGVHLLCSESERLLVRPPREALLWEGAPSLEYSAHHGRYTHQPCTPRQRYYQDRYRKGALRRVVAQEHTGLLSTDERETLEERFAKTVHADDPNVLTCTSTLEMGIDIGDLSSTMLCSMPPNTANYLQRIGRAGRATGTALIVSVVNQRPHDLFFYARPSEMLRGRVDPPGCWLDASAVLVRQYLGYCFDRATRAGALGELPRNGGQLITDLNNSNGHLPRMLQWVTTNEAELRQSFLQRFQEHIRPDTRSRFLDETTTDLLTQRVYQAANEFDRLRRDLINARARLQDQLRSLDDVEQDTRREIEQELHLLRGRLYSLDRTNTLEILTDYGLLPNYAFPERGVRFYGAVYNRHHGDQQEHQPVELVRPAGTALRELAPRNTFYTHSRRFEIQQIAIGNPQQPLIETWGICGVCGHMRRADELHQPGMAPSCPQCGHDGDRKSQLDLGQQRACLEFPRSQALSYMDHYESLSADRDEERQREMYHVIRSFDQTIEAPSGAVGDDGLPFGMEYRASMIIREVNVGYHGEPGIVPFGPDQWASDAGFQVFSIAV
jgi:DEAD/DEAH box helicase domain-containing protein